MNKNTCIFKKYILELSHPLNTCVYKNFNHVENISTNVEMNRFIEIYSIL